MLVLSMPCIDGFLVNDLFLVNECLRVSEGLRVNEFFRETDELLRGG